MAVPKKQLSRSRTGKRRSHLLTNLKKRVGIELFKQQPAQVATITKATAKAKPVATKTVAKTKPTTKAKPKTSTTKAQPATNIGVPAFKPVKPLPKAKPKPVAKPKTTPRKTSRSTSAK